MEDETLFWDELKKLTTLESLTLSTGINEEDHTGLEALFRALVNLKQFSAHFEGWTSLVPFAGTMTWHCPALTHFDVDEADFGCADSGDSLHLFAPNLISFRSHLGANSTSDL